MIGTSRETVTRLFTDLKGSENRARYRHDPADPQQGGVEGDGYHSIAGWAFTSTRPLAVTSARGGVTSSR